MVETKPQLDLSLPNETSSARNESHLIELSASGLHGQLQAAYAIFRAVIGCSLQSDKTLLLKTVLL